MTRKRAKRMQSMAKMTTIRVSRSSIFARKALLRLASIITKPESSSSMCLFIVDRFVIFTSNDF